MTTDRDRDSQAWGGRRVMQLRAEWQGRIDREAIGCHLCGRAIVPGQAWDLDHLTPLAQGGPVDGPVRPAHASCNRSRGASLGNRMRGATRSTGSTAAPLVTSPESFLAWVRSWRGPRMGSENGPSSDPIEPDPEPIGCENGPSSHPIEPDPEPRGVGLA